MYREARLLYKHCYSTLSFFRDIIVTLFLSLMVGEEPWFAPNLDKNITQKSLSLSIYQSPSSRYYRHVFLPICLFSLNRNRERPFLLWWVSVDFSLLSALELRIWTMLLTPKMMISSWLGKDAKKILKRKDSDAGEKGTSFFFFLLN